MTYSYDPNAYEAFRTACEALDGGEFVELPDYSDLVCEYKPQENMMIEMSLKEALDIYGETLLLAGTGAIAKKGHASIVKGTHVYDATCATGRITAPIRQRGTPMKTDTRRFRRLQRPWKLVRRRRQ